MKRFEELAYSSTELGELSLRRRLEPQRDDEPVYEIKLNDEFLMSSLFTVGESKLAESGLAYLERDQLEVVVGGLGLGYTAVAALKHSRLRELVVIELLAPIIDWHKRHLLPLGEALDNDQRCRLIAGDFFALAQGRDGFDHNAPGRLFDAVLLDIDHSPRQHLGDQPGAFYTVAGLSALRAHIKPGGLFGMWSNDPPDAPFVDEMERSFRTVEVEEIRFPNPYQDREATCTLYFGRT